MIITLRQNKSGNTRKVQWIMHKITLRPVRKWDCLSFLSLTLKCWWIWESHFQLVPPLFHCFVEKILWQKGNERSRFMVFITRNAFQKFFFSLLFTIARITGVIKLNTTPLEGRLGSTHRKRSYLLTGTHPSTRSVSVWRSVNRSDSL